MVKFLEAIFRRGILLLFMLLVPIGIGLGIGYTSPPSYQASTTLWALERFEVISTTGPESNMQTTPAGTQTDALSELLQSRVFDISVGQATDLKSTLNLSTQDLANSQKVDDAYVADISKNVQVAVKGTNVYEVSYTNKNAHIAGEVLQSVVNQFQLQGRQFSIIQGQNLLQEDETQLTQIQSAANAAADTESTYLKNNPTSTATNDPQLALLDGQRLQAQSTLQNMETTIATLKQNIADQSAGGGAFFKTLDPAVDPTAPLSRSKVLTTTGGIGAAVGLIACIVYMLIILRRDRGLYTVIDVEKATSYPILMQIPQLPKKKKQLLIANNTK